ncbi:hypothetical protein Hamer_G014234, partial [Homarus americanus]
QEVQGQVMAASWVATGPLLQTTRPPTHWRPLGDIIARRPPGPPASTLRPHYDERWGDVDEWPALPRGHHEDCGCGLPLPYTVYRGRRSCQLQPAAAAPQGGSFIPFLALVEDSLDLDCGECKSCVRAEE